MSAASQIMGYFESHAKVTRPELMLELDLNEKAVESAIRKLIAKGFVNQTNETKQLPGHRPYLVYEKGSKPFTQEAFTRGTARIGRPPRRSVDAGSADSFDALTLSMNALFGRKGSITIVPQGQRGRIYAQPMSVTDDEPLEEMAA